MGFVWGVVGGVSCLLVMEIDDGEKKKRGACEVVKRAMVVSWGDDVAQARIAGKS